MGKRKIILFLSVFLHAIFIACSNDEFTQRQADFFSYAVDNGAEDIAVEYSFIVFSTGKDSIFVIDNQSLISMVWRNKYYNEYDKYGRFLFDFLKSPQSFHGWRQYAGADGILVPIIIREAANSFDVFLNEYLEQASNGGFYIRSHYCKKDTIATIHKIMYDHNFRITFNCHAGQWVYTEHQPFW